MKMFSDPARVTVTPFTWNIDADAGADVATAKATPRASAGSEQRCIEGLPRVRIAISEWMGRGIRTFPGPLLHRVCLRREGGGRPCCAPVIRRATEPRPPCHQSMSAH